MRFGIPALTGALLIVAATAQAQNLVTNPGFETGDFTGWTATDINASVEPDVGHTGAFAASFGVTAPDAAVLSQTLITQIGQRYSLDFFAQTPEFNIPPGSPNALSVFFGGALIDGPFTVPDNPEYQRYHYTVTALTAQSEIRFVISNDPDYTQLDDISVTVAAPEPGALALFMTGGIGSLLARRSRRGKARDSGAPNGSSR